MTQEVGGKAHPRKRNLSGEGEQISQNLQNIQKQNVTVSLTISGREMQINIYLILGRTRLRMLQFYCCQAACADTRAAWRMSFNADAVNA